MNKNTFLGFINNDIFEMLLGYFRLKEIRYSFYI